jgi:hypothetical protein
MGIGAPFTVATTATRHMLDANVTFGMSSSRYNARDKYRRTYSNEQRLGAGIGTAFGVALPVAAGIAWWQRGLRVPGVTTTGEQLANGVARAGGLSAGAMTNVGRVAGLAALGLAAGVGVKKTWEITQDDGNLGAVGTATGIVAGSVAGMKIGQKFAGKYAPLVTGLGAIAGGVAGHFGGKAIKIGEGHIGEEHAQAVNTDDGALDRVKSFGTGAFNHFNEVGPASQGISFGYSWGMREAVQKKYSNAERAGGMHGDLLAAGIMGGGALAVAGGLLGGGTAAGISNVRAGANAAGHVLSGGPVTNLMQKLGEKGTWGVGAAALGITGVLAAKEWDRAMDSDGGNVGKAALYAGGLVAATAGTAALISRSGAVSGMAAAPKAASSALAAAAIIGALSVARLPMQQFVNDAKDSIAADGGVKWQKAAPVGGIAAAAGGFAAFKGLSRMIPDSGLQLGRFHIPKMAVVGVGSAVGAAALGGAGVGLSSTMPDDIKKIGIAAGGGAIAGAATGAFAHGIGIIPGAIGGAALGVTASALLNDEQPAAAEETTPQEAAGTVGG